MHTFRRCPFAGEIWIRLGFEFSSPDADDMLGQWLLHELSSLKDYFLRLFGVTLWKLWWFRNHNLSDYPLDRRCSMILSFLNRLPQHRHIIQLATPIRLPPPPQNLSTDALISGYFDGIFDKVGGLGAGGGEIVSTSGSTSAYFATPYPHLSSALMAEALACRNLLFLAGHLNIKKIAIYGDNIGLINKCRSASDDFSPISSVIFDIKQAASLMDEVYFLAIPRNDNSRAHLLAKHARVPSEEVIWIANRSPG